jgi:hypothetical protein
VPVDQRIQKAIVVHCAKLTIAQIKQSRTLNG